MKRIISGFELTSAERLLLCKIVYNTMKQMEDKDGSVDHLTKSELFDYQLLEGIYKVL